jgi:hypothetical protein
MKIEVPKAQFEDLEDPLINTLEFRTEAGRGGKPLLYLTFRQAKRGVKSADEYARVYIRYQQGRLLERREVVDPQKGVRVLYIYQKGGLLERRIHDPAAEKAEP